MYAVRTLVPLLTDCLPLWLHPVELFDCNGPHSLEHCCFSLKKTREKPANVTNGLFINLITVGALYSS